MKTLILTLFGALFLTTGQPLAAEARTRTPKSEAARQYHGATPKARKIKPAKNVNAPKPRKASKQSGATPKAKKQRPQSRPREI